MTGESGDDRTVLPRRSFLTLGLGAAAATLLASPLEAAVKVMPERKLTLYNTHTGEWLKTTYWTQGRYQSSSLSQVNRFLRDHRSGDVHPIDPKLLDLIATLHRKFGNKGAVHIISGYRSPHSNAALASSSDGVAHNSLHMQGKAVDIRIPGQPTRQLGRAAAQMKAGGVGIYPASDFVHVDVGRVRRW